MAFKMRGVDVAPEDLVEALRQHHQWTFIGVDLASGPDVGGEAEIEIGPDGKPRLRTWRQANPPRPKVERMTILYGTKILGAIDLKKGKDGVWR